MFFIQLIQQTSWGKGESGGNDSLPRLRVGDLGVSSNFVACQSQFLCRHFQPVSPHWRDHLCVFHQGLNPLSEGPVKTYAVSAHHVIPFSPKASPSQTKKGTPRTVTMSHWENVWERRKGSSFYRFFFPADKHSPFPFGQRMTMPSVIGIS